VPRTSSVSVSTARDRSLNTRCLGVVLRIKALRLGSIPSDVTHPTALAPGIAAAGKRGLRLPTYTL
jgi:hypothetical protein